MEVERGKYYHIYNRGNNREDIFYENRNYLYFLNQFNKHVLPFVELYSYCLMKNHFHMLLYVLDEDRIDKSQRLVNSPSYCFKNFFISYAKAINKHYGRTGALFQRPFGRQEITSDEYFARLIHYIHYNPQKHGFVSDFRSYPYSSYKLILSKKQSNIAKTRVIDWFGGIESFIEFHKNLTDEKEIEKYFIND